MTTGAQAIQDLARSEADLVQAHAILDCLQRADACPQEWIDEYERLRSAHYAAGQSTYQQLTSAGVQMGQPGAVPALADPSKSRGNSRFAGLMLRDRGVPRTTTVALRTIPTPTGTPKAVQFWAAFAASAILGYAVYQTFHTDPGADQIRAQSDQFRDYVGLTGPILRDGMLAVRSGQMTPQEYTQLVRALQDVCPREVLGPLPGVASCGLSSCQKWFWAGFLLSAAAVGFMAWGRHAGLWEPGEPWRVGRRAKPQEVPA